MAAYFIAQYTVNNPDLYAEYQAGAGPTLGQYNGELVSFDVDSESVEGTAPGPQTVIIKFEDTAAAKAWYNSDEYQAVVNKPLEATEGYSIISQSMNACG